MAKIKINFYCHECGYESPKWIGKCLSCGKWNTMVERQAVQIKTMGGYGASKQMKEVPQPITTIESSCELRLTTTMDEWNRVLGGGIVPGSLILVGGDPGIGKSTLLLQTSNTLAVGGLKVLYVSGEESMRQIKLRAERLGTLSERLFVLSETNLQLIEEAIHTLQPHVLVVDSIQTVFQPLIDSAPGSIAQVRECTGVCMHIAKGKGIATVLVGHVTKEGAIAGPRMLEHMVDCVLYFEGERHHAYRILRVVKNRFGSTNEIGIFEMMEDGLKEVRNPSELFLQERALGVAGSTVSASLEGTRPVLVEMQALISSTNLPSPRRMATGVDHHRLALIIAVLEKRMGLFLHNQDAYVNVAGGIKLTEPAVDLAIAVAIASSYRDMPTQPFDVIFGEVGLTGEVRGISRVEQRVKEAEKLGFKRMILPEKSLRGWKPPKQVDIIAVNTVAEALTAALG